ncbi:MAG TPA: phosphoribosylaminoimidazolesuccinocarboxamide synthase, partial [Sphingobacterium sp.]|nr:phosphoribosylaminoimidazolesuccinocarboxamide synthase [Sphingobacterium sp.]
ELYEHIVGEKFVYPDQENVLERVERNVAKALKTLNY